MLNKLKGLFRKTNSDSIENEDNMEQPKESVKEDDVESLPTEIAGRSIEAWSNSAVNLGTLDNIEHKLETYDETVGVVKAIVEDEVIIVESATSIEEGGIRDTILNVIKEEVINTPGISQDEVEISVIEVGTTDAAIKASEALEEVLVDKYDL